MGKHPVGKEGRADSFFRAFNKQLERAYRELGEQSEIYQNLIGLTAQYGVETRTNKAGITQIKRSNSNLAKYAEVNKESHSSTVSRMKSHYYKKDSTGERRLNYLFDVSTKVQTRAQQLIAQGITPTKKAIQGINEIEEYVSTFFQNYHSFKESYSGGALPAEFGEVSKSGLDLAKYIQEARSTGNYDKVLDFMRKYKKDYATEKKKEANKRLKALGIDLSNPFGAPDVENSLEEQQLLLDL